MRPSDLEGEVPFLVPSASDCCVGGRSRVSPPLDCWNIQSIKPPEQRITKILGFPSSTKSQTSRDTQIPGLHFLIFPGLVPPPVPSEKRSTYNAESILFLSNGFGPKFRGLVGLLYSNPTAHVQMFLTAGRGGEETGDLG
ncbi:hypothetical protein NDU88_000646 [Pleurodeles waltl]|uniref:Uncharacterized protein n=1 Tax=Pleurodeles waltl TaxID=8319 RepID=A0AAV7S990_PLEWA|nr:hypothetical protein NDU88_000646 [Pleurodeles waltl]